MMNKELFAKFIDELNESNVECPYDFKKEIDGKIYQLDFVDCQNWHDEIVDGNEYGSMHEVFKLVHCTNEDPIKRECNWYALHIIDHSSDGTYSHKLIPMTKVTTYHPEVVIPPHEEEHYIFI